MTEATIPQLAEVIGGSQRLVVLTGAGMSKESGIPTFRDAIDGLWAKYDPAQLATPRAFQANPKLVWDWYQYRRELVGKCEPNPGHYALAQLQDLLPQVIIVTQNIDGFHQMAGSTDVICLHGDIRKDKCFANCQGNPTYADVSQLVWDKESGPPICPHCKTAYLRPDVVWFEEALPQDALYRAVEICQQADVMLVIGTKGAVYPAAQLPLYAVEAGATVVEINPQQSEITRWASYWLPMPSGESLPQILDLIRKAKMA